MAKQYRTPRTPGQPLNSPLSSDSAPNDSTGTRASGNNTGTAPAAGTTDPNVLATPRRQRAMDQALDEDGLNIKNRDDEESIPVRLIPSEGGFEETEDTIADEDLWDLIKTRTVNFSSYLTFMNGLLRGRPPLGTTATRENLEALKNRLPFNSTAAYSLLKFATEQFIKATVDLDNNDQFPEPDLQLSHSPYLNLILAKLDDYRLTLNAQGDDLQRTKLRTKPMLIELIWSYWHEEGMQVQTMNAIARRFQNMRNGVNDPLANLEIDPLRPLNNVLWGYIQDAQHRLTVSRRTYEYDHHYGIKLIGRAVPNFSPADSRSRFIEAFHNLLYRASIYYKEADDLTRRPDGFHVLNALKEVHLLLSEGAHNQFGDLPTTARIEMMMEQWILSQPEIREFLGGRVMVPYDEPWMDRVDTMKTLQAWPSTSITYYHDLARFGEQILLSIRWANWTQVNDRDFAAAWAAEWRNAIQRYIHCYHSVTGMDLGIDTIEQTEERKYVMPALLIQQKYLREQRALRR